MGECTNVEENLEIIPNENNVSIRSFDAQSLMGSSKTAKLFLDGTEYVLRITKSRKLLLTK